MTLTFFENAPGYLPIARNYNRGNAHDLKIRPQVMALSFIVILQADCLADPVIFLFRKLCLLYLYWVESQSFFKPKRKRGSTTKVERVGKYQSYPLRQFDQILCLCYIKNRDASLHLALKVFRIFKTGICQVDR